MKPLMPSERKLNNRPQSPRSYLFLLLPLVTLMLVVVGWPFLRTIWLSFTDTQLIQIGSARFVGLANFSKAVTNLDFLRALRLSAIYAVGVVGLEILLGTLVALLLHQKFRGRSFLRGLLILPWALPTIVNAIMWRLIYNPEYGALNSLLFQLGIIENYVNWLSNVHTALFAIMMADVWKNFSLVALLVLAVLQSLSEEQLEAAHIDGAGPWRRFFAVVLPHIAPSIQVSLVLRTIEATKVFDIIYVMTRGGPANSTRSGSIFIYQEAFGSGRMGSGAAYSLLMVLLIMILIGIYSRMMKIEGAH